MDNVKMFQIDYIERTIDGEEIYLITAIEPIYPSYHKGDTIFLQYNVHNIKEERELKKAFDLTRFEITDVHHSVIISVTPSSALNTYPIRERTNLRLEVYVKRVNN